MERKLVQSWFFTLCHNESHGQASPPTISQSQYHPQCPGQVPCKGHSMVWLRSREGCMEKPARKLMLLMPDIRTEWRPLLYTWSRSPPTSPEHQASGPQLQPSCHWPQLEEPTSVAALPHLCKYTGNAPAPQRRRSQLTHSPGGFSFCSLLTPAGPACSPACLPSYRTFPGGIPGLKDTDLEHQAVSTAPSPAAAAATMLCTSQVPSKCLFSQQEPPPLQQAMPVSCLTSIIFQTAASCQPCLSQLFLSK